MTPLRIFPLLLTILLLGWWSVVPVHWVHHLKIPQQSNHHNHVEGHSSSETSHSDSGTTAAVVCPALSTSKNTEAHPAFQTIDDSQPKFILQQLEARFAISYVSKIDLVTFSSRAPPFVMTTS